jgi:hypothetical protein
MKFFVQHEFVNYPDTREELRLRIFEEAVHKAQKAPFCFFDAYFKANGGRIHPILGNLDDFADEIEAKWIEKSAGAAGGYGLNLVVGLIRHRLEQLPVRGLEANNIPN